MVVDNRRYWESDIDFNVWGNGHRCATCGGLLKYKYIKQDNPNVRLEVLPNAGTFAVKDFSRPPKNRTIIYGEIKEMGDKLKSI